MQDRSGQGHDTPWFSACRRMQKASIFGMLLSGNGQLWIKEVEFEQVGDDVPTTGRKKAAEPGNLELER